MLCAATTSFTAQLRALSAPSPACGGGLGRGRRSRVFVPRISRRNSAGVELGGVFHRLDDFDVAGAAADVAAERCANVVLARARIAPQQARRCHDESGRAVAALGAELLVEPA